MSMHPEDLEVGMYVSVVDGPIKEKATSPFAALGLTETTKEEEDCSFHGFVLKVLAVDLPFVAVLVHINVLPENAMFALVSKSKIVKHTMQFDIRRGWRFKRLTDEYVRALLGDQMKENEGSGEA